jgi:hypothetical protein
MSTAPRIRLKGYGDEAIAAALAELLDRDRLALAVEGVVRMATGLLDGIRFLTSPDPPPEASACNHPAASSHAG